MNNMSEDISKLAEALSKAQGMIEGAEKAAFNPFFKSNYADLHEVWQCCRKPLSDNGLCVIQTIDTIDTRLFVVTTLAHSSGQWIRSHLPIFPKVQDSPGIGAAITYARRSALSSIVGITQKDDDGESNTDKEAHKPQINHFYDPVVKSSVEAVKLSEVQCADLDMAVQDLGDDKYIQWLCTESLRVKDIYSINQSDFNSVMQRISRRKAKKIEAENK